MNCWNMFESCLKHVWNTYCLKPVSKHLKTLWNTLKHFEKVQENIFWHDINVWNMFETCLKHVFIGGLFHVTWKREDHLRSVLNQRPWCVNKCVLCCAYGKQIARTTIRVRHFRQRSERHDSMIDADFIPATHSANKSVILCRSASTSACVRGAPSVMYELLLICWRATSQSSSLFMVVMIMIGVLNVRTL
jgi:hypothetical protein